MKTNLLTTISTAADTSGLKFIYGDGRYFEQNIKGIDLTDGSIGLMMNINGVNPVIEDSGWNGELTYDCQFFLFRKFELTATASLAETLQQKFENRMDELLNEILKFFGQLTQCNNEIDLVNPRYTPAYNFGSVQADGWFLECQLKLINQYPI